MNRSSLARNLGLLLIVGLLAAGGARAQALAATGPLVWDELPAAQRSVLAPLRNDWSSISPAQQQKWAEVARRFPALPPEERERVQQRASEWARLSPQERGSARYNFLEARQLSPQERQQQWEAYRALPADQRRALAERAGKAPPTVEPRRETPSTVKSSVVRAPPPAPGQPVGPSVVQRGAGASTNLISKPPSPPMHQQAGLPKVAATPGFVDKTTLLPQRGAQGAATSRPPAPEGEKPNKAR